MAKDGTDSKMAETQAQFLSEIEDGEQLLEQDQTGEGGKFLILETQGRKLLGFMNGLGLAKLHRKRSPFAVIGWVAPPILPEMSGRFFIIGGMFRGQKQGELTCRPTTPVVSLGDRSKKSFRC